MKKIYINPETNVYNVKLSSVIMMSAGSVGGEGSSTPGGESGGGSGDWDPGDWGGGGGETGGAPGDDDLSRNSNGGNVWDNAW